MQNIEGLLICNKTGHEGRTITAVCVKQYCKQQRACCNQCVFHDHKNHMMEEFIQINDLNFELEERIKPLEANLKKISALVDQNITLIIKKLRQFQINRYIEELTLEKINNLGKQVAELYTDISFKNQIDLSFQIIKETIRYCKRFIEPTQQEIQFNIKNEAQRLNQEGYKLLNDNPEKAIKIFNQGIDLYPDLPNLWNNKGICLTDLERHHEALQCLEQAIHLEPNNQLYLNNKIVILLSLEKYQECLQLVEQELVQNPQESNYLRMKGIVLYKLKKYEDAIKILKESLKFKKSSTAYLFVGRCYDDNGNKQEAQKSQTFK